MLVHQKKCLSVDYNCRANLEEMAAPLLKRVDECMKRLSSAVSKSTRFTLFAINLACYCLFTCIFYDTKRHLLTHILTQWIDSRMICNLINNHGFVV